jgi:hypothetical protein
MRSSIRGAIQLLAGLETNRDLALAAQRDQLLDAGAPGALADQHAIERPPGPQGLPDGMDSNQRGHYDKGTSCAHDVCVSLKDGVVL